MRLLECKENGEIILTRCFIGDDIPKHAILSHTWGPDTDEVSFKDMIDGTAKNKFGYNKIQFCGSQAASDGLKYFWVDTCCIDKSNNTELSEAINSMFRWFRNSTKCYVYLSIFSRGQNGHVWKEAFRKSRWFTRGWTLQELLAPTTVEFFSVGQLGDKKSLEGEIHEITGIPVAALRGSPLSNFSVMERMSWIEKRGTARKEDKACSLLGIFDVHMPLIYGEGRDNAFKRLREEIDKFSKGHSFHVVPEKVNTPVESLWTTGQKRKPPRRYQSSTYELLISPRRSLRLLSLFPGSPNNPEIDCELIMYNFDENTKPVSESTKF